MDFDIFQPVFQLQIAGDELAPDLTGEVTSLSFEDHEAALDLLEVVLSNRHGRFTDVPRFQEDNVLNGPN